MSGDGWCRGERANHNPLANTPDLLEITALQEMDDKAREQ